MRIQEGNEGMEGRREPERTVAEARQPGVPKKPMISSSVSGSGSRRRRPTKPFKVLTWENVCGGEGCDDTIFVAGVDNITEYKITFRRIHEIQLGHLE